MSKHMTEEDVRKAMQEQIVTHFARMPMKKIAPRKARRLERKRLRLLRAEYQ